MLHDNYCLFILTLVCMYRNFVMIRHFCEFRTGKVNANGQ